MCRSVVLHAGVGSGSIPVALQPLLLQQPQPLLQSTVVHHVCFINATSQVLSLTNGNRTNYRVPLTITPTMSHGLTPPVNLLMQLLSRDTAQLNLLHFQWAPTPNPNPSHMSPHKTPSVRDDWGDDSTTDSLR